MIIADTSGLLAYFNRAEPAHARVRDVVDRSTEPLVISPYVIAELDYLILTRLGVDAERAVLIEIAGGAYDLTTMSKWDIATACTVVERYRGQAIGVTDASIVVLADRYRTHTVLTLDHRHFDVLRPLNGGHFDVVP